jgi:hypothetical protein
MQLGRACHLLTDMACPVHAHRVMHEADPFEWYVEAHAPALAQLPMPPAPAVDSVPALVAGLAAYARLFTPDRTHNAWGRMLRGLGVLRPVPMAEVERQARALIPAAAAHVASLFRRFVSESGAYRAESRHH